MTAAGHISTRVSSLPRVEQRLQDRVKALLPSDERILAAAVVNKGASPALDGCLALLPLVHISLLVIEVMVWLGIHRSRSYLTVAVTDRGLLLFTNRRGNRPVALVQRFDDLAALGPINDAGDPWLEVAGTRYWVRDPWYGQLQRLRTLKGRPVARGSK